MPQNDKVKIKLSELTNMYDIENDSEDTENIPEEEKTAKQIANQWQITMDKGDDKLEQEFDEDNGKQK